MKVDVTIPTRYRRVQKSGREMFQRPVEEVLGEAEEASKRGLNLTLGLIAAMIAYVGLSLNSPILILGAMLISPIVAPVHAFAINVIFGRVKQGV